MIVSLWRRNKRAVLPAGIVAIGIVLCMLLFITAPQQSSLAPPGAVFTVATMQVSPTSIAPTIELFGRLTTPNRAQLSAAIDADVVQVYIQEGQRVKRGDPLIDLDSSQALLLVKQRDADLSNALARFEILKNTNATQKKLLQHQEKLAVLIKAKLKRSKALRKKNMISEQALDDVRHQFLEHSVVLEEQRLAVANHDYRIQAEYADIKRAQAALDDARLQLSYTTISAPFDSAISALFVFTGDRVKPGSQLLALYDQSALQVRASIPRQYLNRLRTHLNEERRVVAYAKINKKRIRLTLTQLASEVPKGKSGIEGLFSFTREQRDIALGQMIELTVELPVESNVVAVPTQAIYNDQRVYLVSDGRLKAVEVERVGEVRYDDNIKILLRSSQFTDNTQVVSTRLAQPKTGDMVLVSNEENPGLE